MKKMLIPAVLGLAMYLPAVAFAEVPMLLNYQGHLAAPDGTPKNGTFAMQFSVYDAASGGNQLPTGTPWSETQNVAVTDGVFNVLLGSVTPLPTTLFEGGPTDSAGPLRFLHVIVDGEPLAPRKRITSAAYAISAGGTAVGSAPWAYVETMTLVGPAPSSVLPTDSNFFMMVLDNVSGNTAHIVFFNADLSTKCDAYYQTFQSTTVLHDSGNIGRINLTNGPAVNGFIYFNRAPDINNLHAIVFNLGANTGTLAPTTVPTFGNCGMTGPIERVYFGTDTTLTGKVHIYKLAVQ